MYTYIRSYDGEVYLYTVGYHSPDGEWITDSDWDSKVDAANRAAWLNGSTPLTIELIAEILIAVFVHGITEDMSPECRREAAYSAAKEILDKHTQ